MTQLECSCVIVYGDQPDPMCPFHGKDDEESMDRLAWKRRALEAEARVRNLELELSRVGPGPRIVTLEEVAAKLRGGEK